MNAKKFLSGLLIGTFAFGVSFGSIQTVSAASVDIKVNSDSNSDKKNYPPKYDGNDSERPAPPPQNDKNSTDKDKTPPPKPEGDDNNSERPDKKPDKKTDKKSNKKTDKKTTKKTVEKSGRHFPNDNDRNFKVVFPRMK